MCIRDSVGHVHRFAIDRGGGDMLDGSAEDPGMALAHRLVTVSYTHLRAHETVLDLVCRLLLEQKKTTRLLSHTIATTTAV